MKNIYRDWLLRELLNMNFGDAVSQAAQFG
jgi:hypothetical protein